MSARRPLPIAGNLAARPQTSSDADSLAHRRDDAKRNFLKTMRPLPTQHYWVVYFDRRLEDKESGPSRGEYRARLEQLGNQIESVQDFWRYNNNTPVDQIKMRESIYLFKSGFRPVWEDRRNLHGGSWTLRVPRSLGPAVWTHIQVLAIGEKLQGSLDDGDQLCGVGLSVRFSSHLVSIWHRDSSKQKSIDGMLACVMDQLPPELRPKAESCYYKRHSDHAHFQPPPEQQSAGDAEREADGSAKADGSKNKSEQAPPPQLTVQSPV